MGLTSPSVWWNLVHTEKSIVDMIRVAFGKGTINRDCGIARWLNLADEQLDEKHWMNV